MGTEIIKRGIEPGKIPDILNIEQPNLITEIHKAYFSAGSDICQTCTFGSTPLNLQHYNLTEKFKEINQKALDNILLARPPDRIIAGDIGPTGEFKPPVGNATLEQWYQSFYEQSKILDKYIDVWHIETMSDLDEMLTAVKAIKRISQKPIMSSMTYRKTKRGYFTIMGDSLEKCIKSLEMSEVDVIGTNCTIGSKDMIGLIEESVKITNKPLLVKPNAGLPRLDTGEKTYYDQSVEEFVEDICIMIDLGVKIVGGCCGTSPETIREIRKSIDLLYS